MNAGVVGLLNTTLIQAADIARRIARQESTRLRWATVTSTDPLLIRYDGEGVASVVPPQTVAAVTVGDRVRVAVYRGQATILGRSGGRSEPVRYVYTNGEFFTPGTGVDFGAGGLTMTTDIAPDGSAQVSWSGALTGVPYIAGGGTSNAIGNITQHLPPAHAPVTMTHSSNAGIGIMTTGGQVTMRWGSFSTSGTGTLWLSCTYSIPGGAP